MLRSAYFFLVRLHPLPFRQRFGGEMLLDFEDSERDGGILAIFKDALLSLGRQWVLRSEPAGPSMPQAAHDDLQFYMCGDDRPGRGPLMSGGLLAVLAFGTVAILIGTGGYRSGFLIGSGHPSPSHILPAGTNAPPGDLATEVKLRPYPDVRRMSVYFRLMPVLAALDRNGDGLISTTEMEDAPGVLRSLDKNHDGRLSPEECGFDLGRNPPPMEPARLNLVRAQFMRVHPVLAALDADHDGVISASEMAMASAALKSLDVNRDGRLTENELLPDRLEMLAARMILLLDRNADGVIGLDERNGTLREFLESADRNKDGRVTADEIVEEYQRQEMRKAPPIDSGADHD